MPAIAHSPEEFPADTHESRDALVRSPASNNLTDTLEDGKRAPPNRSVLPLPFTTRKLSVYGNHNRSFSDLLPE